MSIPESITRKEFFDAERKVKDWYGKPSANRNGALYSDEYFQGMNDAFERLETALGFYQQIYIKDRDF